MELLIGVTPPKKQNKTIALNYTFLIYPIYSLKMILEKSGVLDGHPPSFH